MTRVTKAELGARAAIACRACGVTGSDMTFIYRADQSGALVPDGGVCRQCTALPPDKKGFARVFTAIRGGRCPACRNDTFAGDRLARMDDGRIVHAECAQ